MRGPARASAGSRRTGTGRRPAAFPSLLLVAILLGSSLVLLPTAMPNAAATPYPGPEPTPTNLTVFLHNSTLPQPVTGGIFSSQLLTTTNDTASPWRGGGFLDIAGSCVTCVQVPFFLFPRTAGPLTLNGTPSANVFINWTGTSAACTLGLTLSAVSPTGATTTLGSPASTSCTGTKGGLGLPVRLVYGSPLLTTLPAGWSLEAFFTLTGSASNSGYGIWWGKVAGAYYPSDIDLPASTYLAINQTYVVGPSGGITGSLNSTVRTPVAQLRANLSDPLGNYDYTNWTINWTVTSAATGGVFGAGTMTPQGPSVPPAYYGYNETYTAAYNYSWVPAGGYTLCVNATDNTAHNDKLFAGLYGRNAIGCSSFSVGSAPNLLTLLVQDSRHAPLVHAEVDVAGVHNFTDLTGTTHYRLANGTYTGSVTWEGIVVASPSIVVKGPTTLTIVASVFYPVFSIEDQSGQPLSNALVYLVHPNGTTYPLAVTGPSGNLTLDQVPQGSYGVTVIWHDSVVYAQPGQASVDVAANAAYVVLTHVYWQSFQVLEPTGAPISLASVVVENLTTGVVISFGITDASGLSPAHVPYGNFSVLVYWQTSLVAEVNLTLLPSLAEPYVIDAAIFQVSFLALDAQGNPVGGAAITIVGPGGPVTSLVTSPSGSATTVLPGGSYTFVTRWEGVTVNVSTAVVSSAQSITLHLAIYEVTIGTVDAKSLPVSGATVAWVSSTGYANGSLLTNSSGWGIARLPATSYDLSMSWEGVAVGTSTFNVSKSGTLVLPLEVYYLTINTVDNGGATLSGVFVQVLSVTTGVAMASAITGSQPTVLRLPIGTYWVVGTLRTTYDLTPVEQTVNQTVSLSSNEPVTLKFTKAPPSFTSTVEFEVILAFVALAFLLILGFAFVSSRRKRGGAKPSTSPPAAPSTTPSSDPASEHEGSNESASGSATGSATESVSTTPAGPATPREGANSLSSPLLASRRSGSAA